uniref:Uncharacterized protein n=1 Tax=Rhizophora mucronata TaxID=61149 RepID=A0A2P2KQF0_RHIMU
MLGNSVAADWVCLILKHL